MTSTHSAGRKGWLPLAVGALGVVFGDIGTSPLYAIQTVFSIDHNMVKTTPGDVYGVISLVFWSIALVVSVKYVIFILRADNDGEGGVMALAALSRNAVRTNGKRYALVMVLGVLGASLFYGDSVITPAISVMSAIEGLSVPAPGLDHLVVPLGAAIITLLFVVQRYGTHLVGRFFGPVMVLWFAVLGVLGLASGRPRPGHPQGTLALLRPAVLHRAPLHRLRRDGCRRPVDHRCRGALRRHGALRPAAHPPRLVHRRVPLPDAQLPRPGRPDPRPSRRRSRNPFFLLAPSWARYPARRLADPGHGHRLAGGHLRRLLGVPPGRAARLPTPAHGAPHLRRTSAARSTCPPSTGRCSSPCSC